MSTMSGAAFAMAAVHEFRRLWRIQPERAFHADVPISCNGFGRLPTRKGWTVVSW